MVKGCRWAIFRAWGLEHIVLLFGLIIGVLLWYGVSKVLWADHADQSQADSRHQPKGKK
jgi:hypothetical protein